MNYFLLKNFLSSYSLPTLLIALCVAFGCYLLEKLIKKQISGMIKAQLPFIIAILVYFVYDMIFLAKDFVLRDTAFIAGIVCGSLAVVFRALINKLKRGDSSVSSAASLLVEGVLEGVIPTEQLHGVAKAVERLILENDSLNEEQITIEISLLIKENTIEELSDSDIQSLVNLILQAVGGLN